MKEQEARVLELGPVFWENLRNTKSGEEDGD